MLEKKVMLIFAPSGKETETRRYEIIISSSGDPLQDCQAVFDMINGTGDGLDAQTQAKMQSERGMMAGDGVIMDGKIYRCKMAGWREVNDMSDLGFSVADMFN
jgi:hypothetical protein